MRKVFVVIAIVLVAVCGFGGVIGYRMFSYYQQFKKSSVTEAEFDAQKVGAAETAVRGALPQPLDIAEKDLYKNDPSKEGKPVGASCIYYARKPLASDGDSLMYRFCFAGGKLAEKKGIKGTA